ncbi:MAG: FAD-dependent oxidoreductase [Proteobacteria bacterium]|nr:FAD-dependent oxidoreductase [Pseudomonadota bacterium]
MTRWDETADVIIVGCGYAGAVSAIAAHDAGAKVLVLEKMPDPGGISVCSFGGVRAAQDAAAAFAYLKRTNLDTAPDALLRELSSGMTRLPGQVASLAKAAGATTVLRPSPANYPFPGNDTFGFVNIETLADFDAAKSYPHVRGAPGGALLYEVLRRNLRKRGIEIRTKSPVERLICDRAGHLEGLAIKLGRASRNIRARRGIVLACGGFEASPEMQRAFWPEGAVMSAAYGGNTGDGIRMAQALGADLWHMWHYHGSYGFRHADPAYPFGIRTKRLPDWQPGTQLREDVRMPWILLDRRGRRFMNEYDPYVQDTGARAFARYDPTAQDYAAIPAWLVADADGTALYPFGRPTSHARNVDYSWSKDNSREIALGILKVARDIDELARATDTPASTVADQIARWNAACASGSDADWNRPPGSMMPIKRGPFTFAPVRPIVSNTQGGPVHDRRQRIVRPDGSPIARLYAAGEMGSVFGHLYMSGGNIAECFVGGRIAGRNAAMER